MKILVTGGAGFIGSHMIDILSVERPEAELVNLDLGTYAADPARVAHGANCRFVRGDVADPRVVEEALGGVTHVLNFAAETHVDRSLGGAASFARTNLEGVVNLLDAVRGRPVRFLQVSTDEVYGSCENLVPFPEFSPYKPGNPYSVTKAAADMMVEAYVRSFGMDCVITRSVNNYGPRQYPEKLIPVMVAKCLRGDLLPIYGDGQQRRNWIHVRDNCRGILAALEKGRAGHAYNLTAGVEITNLEMALAVCEILGRPGRVEHVADRPGHDRVYRVDGTKALRELGFRAQIEWRRGLEETVRWYVDHPGWTARMEEARHRWKASRQECPNP